MKKWGKVHPLDSNLSLRQLPTAWCPGCGIGIVLNSLLQAVTKCGLKLKKEVQLLTSNLGCVGYAGEYLKSGTIIVSLENLFREVVELKRKDNSKKVILLLSDADLLTFGPGEIFPQKIFKEELFCLYVNSFLSQVFFLHKKFQRFSFISKETEGDFFNLPEYFYKRGAVFTARWTQLHVRRLVFSIQRALNKKGFSFIEVLAPCLMYFSSDEKTGEKIERMKIYQSNCEIKHGGPPNSLDFSLNSKDMKIAVGNFIDY